MKNTFLITAAAAALLTAPGMASAQGTMEQRLPPKTQELNKSESVEQKGKAGAQIKAGENSQQQTQQQDSSKPSATQSSSGTDAATSTSSSTSVQGQSSGAAAQGKTETGASTATQGAAAANVSLSTEQKSRIREVVLKQSDAPRVSNVNFSLTVGTVVPRTVRFAPLPPVLIEIHPAWRGYDYFIVGDQIVVIDPRTLRIVAILAV